MNNGRYARCAVFFSILLSTWYFISLRNAKMISDIRLTNKMANSLKKWKKRNSWCWPSRANTDWDSVSPLRRGKQANQMNFAHFNHIALHLCCWFHFNFLAACSLLFSLFILSFPLSRGRPLFSCFSWCCVGISFQFPPKINFDQIHAIHLKSYALNSFAHMYTHTSARTIYRKKITRW